jgi:hypothetical protein
LDDLMAVSRVEEDFGQVEAGVVQRIEKLKPQLELVSFAPQRNHLAQREVNIGQPWSNQTIPPFRPKALR